jgi:signal transduction histidine kinase
MKILLTFILIFFGFLAIGQAPFIGDIDSLKKELNRAKNDTTRVLLLNALSASYTFYTFDSTYDYSQRALRLSQKAGFLYGQYLAYQGILFVFMNQGDFPKALSAGIESLKMAEQLPDRRMLSIAKAHMNLGFIYRISGLYPKVLSENQLAFESQKASGQSMLGIASSYITSSIAYLGLNQRDSAIWILSELEKQAEQYIQPIRKDSILWDTYPLLDPYEKRGWPIAYAAYANIQEVQGNHAEARRILKQGLDHYLLYERYDNRYFLNRLYINYARLMNNMGRTDSAIYYAGLSARNSQDHNFLQYELEATRFLAQMYESRRQPDSAVKYYRLMIAANDSVYSQTRIRQFQSVALSEEQRVKEIEAAKERYQAQLRTDAMLIALVVFFIIAFILYRNNRQKQKAFNELEKQKAATDTQRVKAEQALTELRATQAQLIQTEKMASLGELTAGIAHEIQNPLNFVNNFAEVNKELIEELRDEQQKLVRNEQAEKKIMSDLEQNLEKINQHGKRADSIVKSMLEHSKLGYGQIESFDFNALADECCRISYHSFRANDKNFNVNIKCNYDPTIEKVSTIKEDLGRVMLNIFNNAFYSINSKRKSIGHIHAQPLSDYQPTVEISSAKQNGQIQIRIRDNGFGIPEKNIDRIFQPFFTTKPAGSGTGLGLSLSYDIIVKELGGQLLADSREGEYAEFTISIPVTRPA